MIIVEPLSTENLRDGIFCPHGDSDGAEMHEQLDAWLSGEMLRGQVARTDSYEMLGFILYYPVDAAPIEILGEGFYVIQCMYTVEDVPAEVGIALVDAAIHDARGHGASGVAVTAFSPGTREGCGYMPSGFFEKMGFSPVGQRGDATLLFARLNPAAPTPMFAPLNFDPNLEGGSVRVDVFDCRRCYVGVKTAKLIDKVAQSMGKKVQVHHHDQNSRDAVLDKGMSSGVFINGELTFFGSPVSEDDIMRALEVALEAYQNRTDRASGA